ncbi:hypothetical protein KJ708_02200 [bacterium]|nr:hypothetical protein [bacterium]
MQTQALDQGHIYNSEQWQRPAMQRRLTKLGDGPVEIKNEQTTSNVAFANLSRKGLGLNKFAIIVDGHAQVFNREIYGNNVGYDPIDPTEFNYVVDDFDGDGDDDLAVSFITNRYHNHEQVELMTFENDGYGYFSRAGFNPEKNAWGMASASCYNGLSLWQEAPIEANLSDLNLTSSENARGLPELSLSFNASDGSKTTQSMAFYQHSAQLDFDTFRINDRSKEYYTALVASLENKIEEMVAQK